jgi:hypothetical protein
MNTQRELAPKLPAKKCGPQKEKPTHLQRFANSAYGNSAVSKFTLRSRLNDLRPVVYRLRSRGSGNLYTCTRNSQ